MDKKYRKMIEQILLDNESFTGEEMKEVYKVQKKSLDSIEVLLGSLFIKYGIDGLLKMSASQKANSGFKEHLKTMGKELGTAEVEKVTSILSEVYSESYYKNGFLLNTKFNILKKEFIDAAVNTKYKEKMFSDRIWTNKADMIDVLHGSITDAMQGKTTIDKVAREIKNTFATQAYESKRLVDTEMARTQTQASHDIGIDSGVTQVMWSATLDNLTADEDADLDGKVWDINEDHPEPPLHPNCRCCLINIPYKGWTPTQRKDNETKDIIPYNDYRNWKSDKGDDE